MRRLSSANIACAAAAFVVPALVYLPVLIHNYGYGDDFTYLAGATGLIPSSTDLWIGQGRPLGAVVFQASFDAAGTIDGLWLVRLWSIVGIGFIALFIGWLLWRAGIPRVLAVGGGIACALLPPFVEAAGWATAAAFPWVCLASGLAGVLIAEAGPRRTAAAIGLFVIAFLVYQPAAMFIWAVVAVRLMGAEYPLREEWHYVRRALIVTAVGIGGATLVVEVVRRIKDVPLSGRADALELSEVPSKLWFFLSRYVAGSARPFVVSSPSPARAALIAGPVLLLIATGAWLRARGTSKARLIHMALIGVTVPLAVLPSLLVRENQFDFRLVIPLAALMLMLGVIATWTLLARVAPERWARPLMAGVVGVALIGGAVSARRVLSENFIRPGTTKDAYLRGRLRQITARPTAIDVFLPRTDWSDFPNLGLLSQRSDIEADLKGSYVVSSTIKLILAEHDTQWTKDVPVDLVPRPVASEPAAVLIDMTPVQRALLSP